MSPAGTNLAKTNNHKNGKPRGEAKNQQIKTIANFRIRGNVTTVPDTQILTRNTLTQTEQKSFA